MQAALMTKLFFFFNDTATTEIYTLSLHDALPIFRHTLAEEASGASLTKDEAVARAQKFLSDEKKIALRSEEHTSELQSQSNLVCRLLLEKKKKTGSPRSITAGRSTTEVSSACSHS